MKQKNAKVYLEITNICNLSCAFCPKTKRPMHKMTEDEFRFLCGRIAGHVDYLYFHLMGEPTYHPQLCDFIRYAKTLSLRPIITTNGTLLSHMKDNLLSADALPYKVNISLHAFEANEIKMSFSDYIGTCLAFAKKASSCGVIVALRLWNLDGRAEGALHEKNGEILSMMHAQFPAPWQKCRTGYKLSERVFLEWGDKFDWPSTTSCVLSEEGFCYALRDQIGILCDGTVVPCCLDANGDIPLGNLFESTLDEILSSPRAKAIYDGFSAHRCTEELCKRCMRAGYYRTH